MINRDGVENMWLTDSFHALKLGFGIVSICLLVSCKAQEQGFAGGGGRAVDQKPKPTPSPDETKEDETPAPKPAQCTEAQLESVNTLTPIVNQIAGYGALDLELNFQPCPAQVGRVQLPILFDIDASTVLIDGYDTRLSYEVSIQGVRVAGPGPVLTILGQDLFGRRGEDYVHFRSEGALSVAPNVSLARLTVKLNSMYVMGLFTSSTPATSNFTVPIYVKVGKSNPVRVNVQFSPAKIAL
jgi:hypothetical protein